VDPPDHLPTYLVQAQAEQQVRRPESLRRHPAQIERLSPVEQGVEVDRIAVVRGEIAMKIDDDPIKREQVVAVLQPVAEGALRQGRGANEPARHQALDGLVELRRPDEDIQVAVLRAYWSKICTAESTLTARLSQVARIFGSLQASMRARTSSTLSPSTRCAFSGRFCGPFVHRWFGRLL
jgi:hypothetical protein